MPQKSPNDSQPDAFAVCMRTHHLVHVRTLHAADPRTYVQLQALHRLQGHPGFARVLDLHRDDRNAAVAVVQEPGLGGWLPGRPLSARRGHDGDLMAVARQLCLAVRHAHQNGVVLRSLRPEHVRLAGLDRQRVFVARFDGATIDGGGGAAGYGGGDGDDLDALVPALEEQQQHLAPELLLRWRQQRLRRTQQQRLAARGVKLEELEVS